uniref:Microsomal triglyceride transfer protein large subunit-like n=1 Tax=Phallusia mammillata TaxID=59560 RepID=A0A6F9DKV4_9ASCI|nr:microsomal triglyceride transfer protein large subunit-like [Phallusia mammillata]
MHFIAEIFCLALCVCCSITVPVGSSGLHFDPSMSYRYSYEAQVILNEADIANEDKAHRMHADVGLKVVAVFELKVRWSNPNQQSDQIIEMEFQEAEIFNVSDRLKEDNSFHSVRRSKSLRSIIKPIIFRWKDGKVEELYVSGGETATSLNVKRGMLGLMQVQTKTGKRQEEDPSGLCNVAFEVDGNEVKKVKDFASCENDEEEFTSLSQVLGVTTSSTSRALYTLSEDLTHIMFAVAMESNSIRVNVKQDVSLFVLGRQKLGLLDTEEQGTKLAKSSDDALKSFAAERRKYGEKYLRSSLRSIRDIKDCAQGCLNINEVLNLYHEELTKDNMANSSSVQAYVTAVRAARQADKHQLTKVMKDKANEDIRLTLIDVLAAAQTSASHSVLMKQLDFTKTEKTGDIERGLSGIAFSSHPSEEVVQDLKKVFKGKIGSPKIKETVGLALGAVLNKFCRAHPDNCKSKTAKEVKQIIRQGLKDAESEDEQTLYIQFVRNSGLPDFIPSLLNYAETSEHPLVHHLAITSLGVYDRKHLGEKVRAVMSRIFHQNLNKYESTVRSAAANLLLMSKPTEREVQNIFLSLPELKSRELANFIFARVLDLIKTNHPSKEVLLKVLNDRSYGNYWILAQAGMASAYTGHIYKTNDSFATYGLFMEYSNAGMMRRTAVDFSLHSPEDSIALTQLGIVAQGLEGLTGSVADEGEEKLDSMVGMASAMMGVKLRPLTFFRGYSNMMSLIWSGSSGDPTGVEAMLLLTDHFQHILLASGLRVKAEVLGAISTKITAEIAFSLWNRNVEIVTTNGGALTVQCRLTLESPIVRAIVRNSFDAQTGLQFSVFTDFSSLPPKSCMRLSYPSFEFETSLRKFERVKGSKKRLLTLRRRRSQARGITLPLHQGNSQMCTKIVTS